MHYYKRNIGDYSIKAGHLSALEHGVYTLLLDSYYNRERGPTKAEAIRWARARTAEELAAVDAVLAEFFTEEGGVYVQSRVEQELSAYRANAETNRAIAVAREKAKRARTVLEPCQDREPNHKPRTKNQEEKQEQESSTDDSRAPAAPDAPTRSDPIPYQAIVDAYNATMTGLSKVREVTKGRKTRMRNAWTGRRKSVAFWEAYFAECQRDAFLSGQGPYGRGHENWRPDFDYLTREDVIVKTYERAIDRMERGNE